ncbi:hypothetical protein M0802_004900 [Mischocyttarus mexicanus]|nr:hypothetical protein M0802_004900 [Mischocyttarus mexicanus]
MVVMVVVLGERQNPSASAFASASVAVAVAVAGFTLPSRSPGAAHCPQRLNLNRGESDRLLFKFVDLLLI